MRDKVGDDVVGQDVSKGRESTCTWTVVGWGDVEPRNKPKLDSRR